MSKTIAIIPARGGSKGIPRKNIQDINGMPLIAYTIKQAINAIQIDDVIVNSEDEEIRNVALSYGAEVISRPEEFFHDNTIQEVDRLLIWTVKELEKQQKNYDIIVLLYATAPLRDIASIDKAIKMVKDGDYDSVLSVYEDTTYLWKKNGKIMEPINYNPKTRGPRQKENWNQWAENKAIYVMRRNLLIETGCRLGGKIGAIEMAKWQSVDIDRPDDLEYARLMMKIKNQ